MVGGLRVGPGDVVGQHLGLLPQRRDQAVHLAAVLDALADGVDVASSTDRIWSSTTMARSTVKPLVTATSTFGRMPAATTTMSQSIVRLVAQPDAGDLVACPGSRWSGSLVMHADAELLHAAPQDLAGLRPSCAFIRCAPECTTSTCDAVALQAAGRLQAEQAAADHHAPCVVSCVA